MDVAIPKRARFGVFELDLRAGELRNGERTLLLQEQPFKVLLMLVEHHGDVVLREDIRKKLWPNDTVVEFDHAINTAIKKIRQALGDSAENPQYIETVARRGYRLMMPVEWVETKPDQTVSALPAIEPEVSTGNLTGKKVSHYRVLEILGGGGMGVVYKAEDLKLGRRVALKFLPEELGQDPKALERFEREARAVSALDHPNICAIHEFGEHDGLPFMVMPLLEGRTLRDRLAEGARFAVDMLVDIAIQIASGLEAAHNKGIIHRDIKPANIFITTRGEVKIFDFGLAKPVRLEEQASSCSQRTNTGVSADLNLTRTGVALGTAAYMSPEQVRGEKLDARTDLFSFGLVLYEMAAGRQAFSGHTTAILHDSILNRTPTSVRKLNPEVPPKLEEIINKALEKDLECRYQSAEEIKADLERVQREAEPKSLRPRWRLAVAGVLVILAIGATTLWFTIGQPVSQAGLPEVKQRQLTANTSETAVVGGAISPDGKYVAFSDVNGIHIKLIETGETHDVPQPESLKGMNVNWGIVSTWIRDGTRFVANAGIPGQPPSIWTVPLTGEPRKLRDDAFAGSVSRDGSWVAFTVHNYEMWVMKSDGEQARKVFQAAENDALFGAEWSPGGQRILYNYFHQMSDGGEFSLQSRDLAGSPAVIAVVTHRAPVSDWSWLPDGRLVYSIAEPGPASGETCNFWALRVEPTTGKPNDKPKRLTDWAGFCADCPSPTMDSKRLAFRRLAWQGHVDVADLEANGTRISHMRRLTQNEGRNYPASWTTDSKAVVFGAYRDGRWKIFKQALERDTAEPIVTTTKDMYGAEARVSPDGAWVLYMAPPLDEASFNVGVRLMRAPINGGPSELVLTARIPGYGDYHDPMCARAPSSLCVITEESDDGKLIFTAFEPVKGRGRELERFDTSYRKGAYDWDLSPDGTRMAVLKFSDSKIHIAPLDGKPLYDIVLKSGAALETVNWTSNGKGLYAASVTPHGWALLQVDFQGNSQVLWQQKGSAAPWGANTDVGLGGPAAPWAVPSPDGRHLAIYSWSLSANMWMMESF